jgi:peptidyl-dipeptidase Dcp
MEQVITLDNIVIRNELQPGDLGYIIYLHGALYHQEYNYGISFEAYVALGLSEAYQQYNAMKDKFWICEHQNKIIGFLCLVDRGAAAQLRYFLLLPKYRGIGLGNKLLQLFMICVQERNYKSVYLWTTEEQSAAAHLYKKYGFTLTEEKETATFGKLLKEQRYDCSLATTEIDFTQ